MYIGEPHSVAAITPSCRNRANPKSAEEGDGDQISDVGWDARKRGERLKLTYLERYVLGERVLAFSLVTQKNVLRFEVAMDDALADHGANGSG